MDSPSRASPGSPFQLRLQRQRDQVVRKLSVFSVIFVVLTIMGLVALYRLRIKAAETPPASVISTCASQFLSWFPFSRLLTVANFNDGFNQPTSFDVQPLAGRALERGGTELDSTNPGEIQTQIRHMLDHRRHHQAADFFPLACFSALLPLQSLLGAVYIRTCRRFTVTVLCGLALEVAGYLGRVWARSSPSLERPTPISQVSLTLGPAFLTIALYQVLTRLQRMLHREKIPRLLSRTRICTTALLIGVVVADVLSATLILPQWAGIADKSHNSSGSSSSGGGSSLDAASRCQEGRSIQGRGAAADATLTPLLLLRLIVGIVVAGLTLLLLLLAAPSLTLRRRKLRKQDPCCREWQGPVASRLKGQRASKRLAVVGAALVLATVLLALHSIIHLVTTVDTTDHPLSGARGSGFDSGLASSFSQMAHRVRPRVLRLLDLLDGAAVVATALLVTLFHPGLAFGDVPVWRRWRPAPAVEVKAGMAVDGEGNGDA